MVLNLKCLLFFMTFFFNVTVQDAFQVLREPLHFYMNLNNIKYFPNKTLQQYQFYNGEAANVTCYTSSIGHVVLQYSSANGRNITLERHRATSVYIYKKLKTDDLFSCTYAINSTSNNFISVKTVVRTKSSGMLTFKVNNLVLSPYYKDGNIYYYRYKYYSGELLKIDVLKGDEFEYVSWNLGGDGDVPLSLRQYLRNHTALADLGPFTLKKIHTGTSLYGNFLRSTGQKKYYIELTFLLQTQYYDPYIYQLSLSNVFLQYTSLTGAIVIEYEIGNGTANLRCPGNTYWKYSREKINRTYNNVTSSYKLFKLQPYCNSANVTCLDKNTGKTTHLTTLFRENHVSEKNTKRPSTRTPKKLTTNAVVATAPKEERTMTVATTQFVSITTPKTKHNINKKKTRTMRNLLPVGSSPEEFGTSTVVTTTSVKSTTTLKTFSSSEILAQADLKDSKNSTWVVVVVVATLLPLSFVIMGTLITVRYCRQRNKSRGGSSPKAGDGGDDRGAYNSGLMETEHVYETIQDPIYDEPYACPATHAASSEPVRDMSKRPPLSVPAEELRDVQDDDRKYIHYDTPYDFRIFRFGNLTNRYPNLFRTQRSGLWPN